MWTWHGILVEMFWNRAKQLLKVKNYQNLFLSGLWNVELVQCRILWIFILPFLSQVFDNTVLFISPATRSDCCEDDFSIETLKRQTVKLISSCTMIFITVVIVIILKSFKNHDRAFITTRRHQHITTIFVSPQELKPWTQLSKLSI